MGAASSRAEDDQYRAHEDENGNNHADDQPVNQPTGLARGGLLGSETLMLAPSVLSFNPQLGHPPFPRLTASQMTTLRDSGVDLDLCFQPYQMPRLQRDTWQPHNDVQPKQKRFVYINSTMNVRKESVSISSDKRLSFVVDVSVPCRITVWLGASQVNEADAVTPLFECHPRTSYHVINFTSGNEQRVEVDLNSLTDPDAFSLPVSSINQSVDPSADDDTLNLFQQSRQFWPLIIHLQDLTPGKPETCDNVSNVSDVTPTSIDHFFLYCTFTRSSNPGRSSTALAPDVLTISELGVQVMKRVVRCGAYRFELGDVYGMRDESSAAPESSECVICLSNRRTHAIYPCRHLCLCSDCATELARQSTRCPICRKAVQTVIPVVTDTSQHMSVDIESS